MEGDGGAGALEPGPSDDPSAVVDGNSVLVLAAAEEMVAKEWAGRLRDRHPPPPIRMSCKMVFH